MTIDQLLTKMRRLGHRVFEDQSKPYNLNIVGLRLDKSANKFNDKICVFWQYDGEWNLLQFKATTDPGTYWLQNPMNLEGTAIVVPGQYSGLWKIGKHQGKYEALVQKSTISVYRDNDRDLELDKANITQGLYGINCHRANSSRESTQVDKWSAGCQVLANPDDFEILLSLCKASVEYWGNSFTYTLIDES